MQARWFRGHYKAWLTWPLPISFHEYPWERTGGIHPTVKSTRRSQAACQLLSAFLSPSVGKWGVSQSHSKPWGPRAQASLRLRCGDGEGKDMPRPLLPFFSSFLFLFSVKSLLPFLYFFFFNFYCYSITVVCLFSPSLHPTPAEPFSLFLDSKLSSPPAPLPTWIPLYQNQPRWVRTPSFHPRWTQPNSH